MSRGDAKCRECEITTKKTVNSHVCPGFFDGLIRPLSSCDKFKRMPAKIGTTQALAYLSYLEIPVSRPTLVKLIVRLDLGKQPFGQEGRWIIDAGRFLQVAKKMEGE